MEAFARSMSQKSLITERDARPSSNFKFQISKQGRPPPDGESGSQQHQHWRFALRELTGVCMFGKTGHLWRQYSVTQN